MHYIYLLPICDRSYSAHRRGLKSVKMEQPSRNPRRYWTRTPLAPTFQPHSTFPLLFLSPPSHYTHNTKAHKRISDTYIRSAVNGQHVHQSKKSSGQVPWAHTNLFDSLVGFIIILFLLCGMYTQDHIIQDRVPHPKKQKLLVSPVLWLGDQQTEKTRTVCCCCTLGKKESLLYFSAGLEREWQRQFAAYRVISSTSYEICRSIDIQLEISSGVPQYLKPCSFY